MSHRKLCYNCIFKLRLRLGYYLKSANLEIIQLKQILKRLKMNILMVIGKYKIYMYINILWVFTARHLHTPICNTNNLVVTFEKYAYNVLILF